MRLAWRPLDGQTGHQAGRALLEQLYRAETGQALPPIRVAPRGKPYLEDSPWHFSISHTCRRAVCVLAREEVGVDAEELDRRVYPGLADRILSPGEKAQFAAAGDKNRALLTFWELKEAAAKCSGQGLRGFPNETDFSLTDRRVRELDGCLVAIVTEGGAEHAL